MIPPDSIDQDGAGKPSFVFHKIPEILSLPDPEWLIENLLIKGSLAVLFGPPGVGKSFLALSWSLAVASEKPWLGREVKGGPVVFVAAEGFGGLKLRVAALLKHDGYGDDAQCRFIDCPIKLTDLEEVKAFIAALQESVGQPALVIIDTLARCFVGGDENSAKDTGQFIYGVDLIRRETGATVLPVHHTGKDDRRGARGSSALMGAADTMIQVEGADLGQLTVTCTKQKDADPFAKFHLIQRTVELGDGRSSCVLMPLEGKAAAKSSGNDATSKEMLDTLGKFQPEGATATEWQKACESEGISRETFFRRLKELKGSGLVEQDGDRQGARYRLAKSEPVSGGVKPMS